MKFSFSPTDQSFRISAQMCSHAIILLAGVLRVQWSENNSTYFSICCTVVQAISVEKNPRQKTRHHSGSFTAAIVPPTALISQHPTWVRFLFKFQTVLKQQTKQKTKQNRKKHYEDIKRGIKEPELKSINFD